MLSQLSYFRIATTAETVVLKGGPLARPHLLVCFPRWIPEVKPAGFEPATFRHYTGCS
jgi:hypothetical protein